MSLKARLNRLDNEIEWLRWWGRLRAIELQMELLAFQRKRAQMEEGRARAVEVEEQRRAAARREAIEQEKRRREPPPVLPKLPPLTAPALVPALIQEPVEPPFNYDPPEHMQIRPVRWGTPRQEPYDNEGKCLVDYDPLADEYGDDS